MLLSFPYKAERDALRNLINKIVDRNSDLSYADIFDMFCKGKFSGNILTIGKLVEKTFGRGTFKKLGVVTSGYKKTEDFTSFVDNL